MVSRFKCLFLFFIAGLAVSAKERTDTLTFGRSSLYVTYNVKASDESVVVEFIRTEMRDCNIYGCNPEELAVVFFYERSGYDIEFRGIGDRTPLSIQGDVEFENPKNGKGYAMLNDERSRVELAFKLKDAGEGLLTVPVYLALFVREKGLWPLKKAKSYYEIRADWRCGNLRIPLKRKEPKAGSGTGSVTRQVTETITEEHEIGDGTDQSAIDSLNNLPTGPTPEELRQQELENNMKKARRLMDDIKKELAAADRLPFPSTLAANKDMLTNMKNDFDDDDFRDEIQEVLDSCTSKEQALTAEEEAKSKKKTIWMIVGGILLAVLTFVGNQVFQHFKNVRNNKSILEMTENMGRRAVADAERKAKGKVRSKVNNEVNAVKHKTKDTLRSPSKQAFKGKAVDNPDPSSKGKNKDGKKYTI